MLRKILLFSLMLLAVISLVSCFKTNSVVKTVLKSETIPIFYLTEHLLEIEGKVDSVALETDSGELSTYFAKLNGGKLRFFSDVWVREITVTGFDSRGKQIIVKTFQITPPIPDTEQSNVDTSGIYIKEVPLKFYSLPFIRGKNFSNRLAILLQLEGKGGYLLLAGYGWKWTDYLLWLGSGQPSPVSVTNLGLETYIAQNMETFSLFDTRTGTEIEPSIEITGSEPGISFVSIDYSIIPLTTPGFSIVVKRGLNATDYTKMYTLSYDATGLTDINVLPGTTYHYKLQLFLGETLLDEKKTDVTTEQEVEVTYETSEYTGKVELPEGIDSTTLVVRNMDKVAPLDTEGNFEIDVKGDQVSLLFCSVPDYEIPLMTVVSPGVSGMELQSAQEMNELTTAKSLLMLNPFLATPFPDSMAKVNEAIDACSYLQTLEHLIERLNNGESEVEDELVDTIGSALDEIIEYLNEHYPMEENSTIYPTKVVLPLLDGESNHMYIINIDQETTYITCPIIEKEGKQYYKIVPRIPNIRFSLNSVVMLTKMNDSLSNDMMLEFQHTSPIGPYIEGLPQFGAVKSDCFTEWIDIFGKIIDEAIDILFEVMLGDTETPLLIIPAYEEGNYAFTAYGGFADSTENEIFLDDLWSFILKVTSGEGIDVTNLPYELLSFITMIRLNLMDIVLNVVSMVADISELSGEELSSGVVNATMKGLEHGFKAANFISKTELQSIGKWAVFAREYAVNASVELVKVVTEIAVKAGAGKAAGAVLKIIGKEALKYLTVVPKVLSIASNGGEIVARVTSMLAIATPRELTFISVRKQNEIPTVTKVSGPSGTISQSSSTFTWTGSDPDGTITKYEYRKDGGSWVSNGTSTNYTWSGYSEGDHKFEVRAQDNDEQYSEAVEWNFTYSMGTVIVGEMVLVEGGTFMMGDTWGDGYSNELPVHQVTLTYDFYMGKYEVTFNEYDAFCDATGRSKPGDYGWGRGIRPVIYVSWWDAIAYCNWLSQKEGIPVAYRLRGESSEGQMLDANGNVTTDITKVLGYRLPTEAEWEYAARGGKYNSPYKYSGSDNVGDVAWYWSNSGSKTHEVGTKAPNDLGIHDMSGNVWEWCSDWWCLYTETPKTNPYNSATGSDRVVRGGSWNSNATFTRVADRSSSSPTYANFHLGFRICRTVP